MLEKTINNAICALLFRCEQQSVKEMDKIHAMQLFIKVAELESFSRAADFFALPKGSVSRQIQALEHQLGTQLLQRTTRRVKLTPEGMTYYQRAKDVLSNLSELDGLFLAADKEHCEVGVRVSHNVPDCSSRSLVKGVAGGEATGAFQGLVYVAPGAQRTDAQQTSRNVELSTGARIVAKPQLEIYADDVKCTHGATVGQMDDEAILYMRQRGLSEQQARRLQMEGFVAAIAAHCAVEPLCEELYRRIVAKLERM